MTAATLWRPRSQCGPACLTGGAPESVPAVRQGARLLALVGVLALAAPLSPALLLAPRPIRHALVAVLARVLLRAVGARLVVRGRLPRRGALLVANHVSWLDAIALLAAAPARMLAKREVRGWPLVGPLAVAAGTLFVDRTRPRRLPWTVAEVTAVLRAGGVVAAFPEGTTYCGADTGDFRPALFQAAIDAGAPVVPTVIAYRSGGPGEPADTTVAAFLGDDSLWRSLRRVLAARGLLVSLAAGPALHPGPAASRRTLARICQTAVRGPRTS